MIYGYARVSTKGQATKGNSLEDQEIQLRQAGATEIFKDSFTGTKVHRPELDKLMNVIGSGDTLIVTKLDRVARTVKQGIELIDELLERGVTVNILNMGVMNNTPTGKVIRNIFFAFAEFERDMIIERTTCGKQIAKKKDDFTEGRPRVYGDERIAHDLKLLETESYNTVAKLTGISKSTLVRAVNESKRKALEQETN